MHHDYIIHNEWMDTNGISFIHDMWKGYQGFTDLCYKSSMLATKKI